MSKTGQAPGISIRDGVSLSARFVLLAAASLALMVVDQRHEHLERLRSALGLAVYPLQLAVDLPFSTWESLNESMTDRETLRIENERLQRMLQLAEVRLQDYASLERENDRLRLHVRAIDDQRELDIRMAEVLSLDLDNRTRFIINRGANDAVRVGQPLLDASGIVGQVSAVFPFSSEALLITDVSHRIHVVNTRTSQRTIVQGTGDNHELKVLYVTNEDDIKVGDKLETTGMGEVFPPGRPVASITRVDRQPGQPYASVFAQPIADLDRDQEVLLVMNDLRSSSEVLPLESTGVEE